MVSNFMAIITTCYLKNTMKAKTVLYSTSLKINTGFDSLAEFDQKTTLVFTASLLDVQH